MQLLQCVVLAAILTKVVAQGTSQIEYIYDGQTTYCYDITKVDITNSSYIKYQAMNHECPIVMTIMQFPTEVFPETVVNYTLHGSTGSLDNNSFNLTKQSMETFRANIQACSASSVCDVLQTGLEGQVTDPEPSDLSSGSITLHQQLAFGRADTYNVFAHMFLTGTNASTESYHFIVFMKTTVTGEKCKEPSTKPLWISIIVASSVLGLVFIAILIYIWRKRKSAQKDGRADLMDEVEYRDFNATQQTFNSSEKLASSKYHVNREKMRDSLEMQFRKPSLTNVEQVLSQNTKRRQGNNTFSNSKRGKTKNKNKKSVEFLERESELVGTRVNSTMLYDASSTYSRTPHFEKFLDPYGDAPSPSSDGSNVLETTEFSRSTNQPLGIESMKEFTGLTKATIAASAAAAAQEGSFSFHTNPGGTYFKRMGGDSIPFYKISRDGKLRDGNTTFEHAVMEDAVIGSDDIHMTPMTPMSVPTVLRISECTSLNYGDDDHQSQTSHDRYTANSVGTDFSSSTPHHSGKHGARETIETVDFNEFDQSGIHGKTSSFSSIGDRVSVDDDTYEF